MIFKRKKAPPGPEVAKPSQLAPRRNDEPSFIAADAVIEGNIATDGEIHIDGELRGALRAHTCLVEAHGQVSGPITAQYVLIRGKVFGPITATRVTIQKGAHVEGDVVHDGLSVEHGAFVMGNISQNPMLTQAQPASMSSPNYSLLPPRAGEK